MGKIFSNDCPKAHALMPDFDTSRGATPTKAPGSDTTIPAQALLRYSRWLEKEMANINEAYGDLNFCWADAQWDAKSAADRATDGRPCLIINHLPQFIHQVTGDMRQMKPAIHVVPVDSNGDKDTAKTIGGMIRYIENRSDASAIYTAGADSQVSCGIGAWRVATERGENTFNQEIRIEGVSDAVAIACDPDAHLPCREDAKWWIVPVDMSREAFKEQYPDAPVEDFDTLPTPSGLSWGGAGNDAQNNYYVGWYSNDMVRVAEYWVKEPMKRTLALMQDGAIVDLTDKEPDELAAITAQAKTVEKRDSHKVKRYLITAAHVLEEADWPGMLIPIVPVIGEEIRIGRNVVRRGLIRSAKDAQRMVNYFFSAHTETIALQPKAPYLVTHKNIEQYQQEWGEANTKNQPYLIYEPDTGNGGAAPQRVPPALKSEGILDGLGIATDSLKAVIGIYDASLGKRSNETSGKAIEARQREGDTGSFVYIDNWTRAIKRTGTIILDLMPHVYDTERMVRIMGEDGKVDLKQINKPIGMQVQDPMTGQVLYHDPRSNTLVSEQVVENDLTVGAYDVVMETGPSYATKREEARDNMVEFIRSAPDTAPAVMDLVAKAQDWPLADEFANRLEAIAPPPVQKLIAKQKQEAGEEEQPDPPSPQEQLMQQGAEAEVQTKVWQAKKLQAETMKIAQEARPQDQGADPSMMADVAAKQQKMQTDAEMHRVDMDCKLREADSKEKLAAVQLEIALVNLAIAKAKGAVDTAGAVQDMQDQGAQMQRDADNHTMQLVSGARDAEKADESAAREAENADRTAEREDMLAKAKVKQMNKPKMPA